MLFLGLLFSSFSLLLARMVSAENPICFDTCFGVNSTVYTEAIDYFCNDNDGTIISQYDQTNAKFSIVLPYEYPFQVGTGESGIALMQVTAVKDGKCPDGKILDYYTCLWNMLDLVYQCNIGESGKQGGYWTIPCLAFTFQPNPLGC